jgi:cytochrome P450
VSAAKPELTYWARARGIDVTTIEDAAEVAESAALAVFLTPEGRANPYPFYQQLREAAPVYYSPSIRAWLLTGYADCAAVLRDPRFAKAYVETMDLRRPWWREHPAYVRASQSMLNLDGAAHTRLRRLVTRSFTPRAIERLRPRMQAMVDDLLEPFAKAGGGDLIAEVAFPLPVRAIGELLGVPEDDRLLFCEWIHEIVPSTEPRVSREALATADAATRRVDEYFYKLIDDKRAHPGGDDLLSQLLALDAAEDGDRLTDEELVTLAVLLFAAGFETTTNLIGTGMLGLLRHPGQADLLRTGVAPWAGLADEFLRYDGTVQLTSRFAMDDVEVGGQSIKKGDAVLPLVGAANRDPSQYDEPDVLDVTRTEVRPLTFGGGVHLCLGAALARAEIEILFQTLLPRFPTIELDGPEPQFREGFILRGLVALPLKVSDAPGVDVRESVAPPRSHPHSHPEPPPAAAPVDGELPLRPSGAADLAWREAYRQRLESARATTDTPEHIAGIARLFARTPFFRAFSLEELEGLAATAYELDFLAGDVLCAEGEEALDAYVIAEGEAAITIGGELVRIVESDDVVGERGPIEGQRRSATATARTHMLAYSVSRDRLLELLDSNADAAAAFRTAMTDRYGDS